MGHWLVNVLQVNLKDPSLIPQFEKNKIYQIGHRLENPSKIGWMNPWGKHPIRQDKTRENETERSFTCLPSTRVRYEEDVHCYGDHSTSSTGGNWHRSPLFLKATRRRVRTSTTSNIFIHVDHVVTAVTALYRRVEMRPVRNTQLA